MDDDQVRVIEIAGNAFGKLILDVFTGIVFLAVSIKLILDPSWPIAVAHGFLDYTVYRVFRHHYPTDDE